MTTSGDRPVLTDELFAAGYDLDINGVRYRQAWRGLVDAPIDRVRALAFTDAGEMLLVEGDTGFQLPGGGVEAGESPTEALHRELWEEAAATIGSVIRMGATQIDVLDDGRREFHDFYCCRVSLEEKWTPPWDITSRITVPSHAFLDTLHWGHDDPKGAFLLELALRTVTQL